MEKYQNGNFFLHSYVGSYLKEEQGGYLFCLENSNEKFEHCLWNDIKKCHPNYLESISKEIEDEQKTMFLLYFYGAQLSRKNIPHNILSGKNNVKLLFASIEPKLTKVETVDQNFLPDCNKKFTVFTIKIGEKINFRDNSKEYQQHKVIQDENLEFFLDYKKFSEDHNCLIALKETEKKFKYDVSQTIEYYKFLYVLVDKKIVNEFTSQQD
ncbi:1036_t:CDS:2 [Dentiscutata heterogama]|uniref:1036_t:CDS:1 n=1 Tax=Dentiscutata heterogama TaxID=1316150 RepID=A0ACA9LYY4_9GLOM|nr:1036_t:CDS:2 [Dentiscutata heterogama]